MKRFTGFMALAAFTALHVLGQDIFRRLAGLSESRPPGCPGHPADQERQGSMDGNPAEH